MLSVSWFIFLFFFFKQMTAYEMRISDWSSDVCSSDPRIWHRDRPRADAHRRGRPRRRLDIGVVDAILREIGFGDVAARPVERVFADRIELERTFAAVRDHPHRDRKSVV